MQRQQKQRIELDILQTKHMERMVELQKERLLLNHQNHYQQHHSFIHKTSPTKILPEHIPILKPHPTVERLLYQNKEKVIQIQKMRVYPPSIREAIVAEKQIENLLRNWKYESQFMIDNEHLRSMRKYQYDTGVLRELTPSGQNQIKQIIGSLEKSNHKMSLKEKYSAQYEQKQPLAETSRKGSLQRMSVFPSQKKTM